MGAPEGFLLFLVIWLYLSGAVVTFCAVMREELPRLGEGFFFSLLWPAIPVWMLLGFFIVGIWASYYFLSNFLRKKENT